MHSSLVQSALTRVTIAAAALAIFAASSSAGINFYRVGKRISYAQTSDSQPTTSTSIDGGVDLFASDPADLTSARVFSTKPSVLSPASPFHLTQFSPGHWGTGQLYLSVEAMDTNLPPGDTFGFLIEGGLLNSRLALLPLPAANLFPADVPYFTNNAYSTLNGMEVTSPFTITWNGFTPEPGSNDSPIFLNIYPAAGGPSVIGAVVSHSQTSFLIPANTFSPATQYRAELAYSSRLNVFDAGFIDADSGATFDLVTQLHFKKDAAGFARLPAVPEPNGAALVLALCGAWAFARRRSARPLCILVLTASAVTALSQPAAAINFYRGSKTIVHQQTSNIQPSAATTFYGGVDLFTPAPEEFTSARVFSTSTMPPAPTPEFVLNQFSAGHWGWAQGFSTLVAMDETLPPGDTFGFLIEGGSLGSQLALLPTPAANQFAIETPYFTGDTFARLQNMDPRLPLTLTWNDFLPTALINSSPTFVNVYRVLNGQTDAGTVVASNVTSFEIPANALAPNTDYRASLNFSSRIETVDAGFGDADSGVLFDSVTEIQFTTGSGLSGDYNRDGAVNGADYVLWRKTLGQLGVVPFSGADGDGDGDILEGDYSVWRTRFGATSGGSGASATPAPEATTVTLALLGLMGFAAINRRRPVV
jgi:hypothetical protein